MMILITGPPGSGKSTLINKLNETLNYTTINITDYIKTNKLYDFYNSQLDTYEYTNKKVKRHLKLHLKQKTNIIIESHSPSTLKGLPIDYVFYLERPTTELVNVYKERGYSIWKINENINCINFSNILDSCFELFKGNVVVLNVRDKESAVLKVLEIIR
ncbi:Adenylate kinase isoenzyme 6 like protein [Cucumispora dikerogammari]|nr:Adenylate kinase isoenzyme 6 like protein [Cucumispora dikerogammari]